MTTSSPIRVGTRGSLLARTQTDWVLACLRQAHPAVRFDVVVIRTRGDMQTQQVPARSLGKGYFTKEIEEALLAREVEADAFVMATDADAVYDLSAMLAKRSQGPSARPDDPKRAADCLFQLARMGDPGQGLEYLEYALDLFPDHDAAIQLYARRTTEAGMTDRFAERVRGWYAARGTQASSALLRAAGQVEWAIHHDARAARPIFELLAHRGDAMGAQGLAELGGGANSAFNHSSIFLLVGTFLGGMLSGVLNGRFRLETRKGPRITTPVRLAAAFVGGVIMVYGARLARGCTSGQALSGGAVLSVGSWAFMFAVFGGGYAAAWFVRRLWT